MAEKRIVCFQSKKVKTCRFLFLTTIIYIARDILKKIVGTQGLLKKHLFLLQLNVP